MKYKPSRIIKWIFINTAMAILAYRWLVMDKEMSENVFKFVFWLNVISIAMISAVKESAAKMRAEGPSVPLVISNFYDCASSVFLAAHGHFTMAVFCLIEIVLLKVIFDAPQSTETTETAATKE